MKKLIVGMVLLFVVSSAWAQMSPASKDTAGRPVVFSGGAANGVGFTNIPLSNITGTSVLATDAEVSAAIAAIPPPEAFDGTIQTVKTMAVVGGAYPGMGASENLHLRGGYSGVPGVPANVYVSGNTTFSNNMTVVGNTALPAIGNITAGGEQLGDVIDEYVSGWAAFPVAGSLIDGGGHKTNLTIFAGIAQPLSNTRPTLTLKGGRLFHDLSQTWGDVEVWGQLVGKPQTNFVIRAADAVTFGTLPQELHLRGGEEYTKGQGAYAAVVIDSELRPLLGISMQDADIVADEIEAIGGLETELVTTYTPGRDLVIHAGDATINPPQNYNGGDLYLAGGSNSNFPSKAPGEVIFGSDVDFQGNTIIGVGPIQLDGLIEIYDRNGTRHVKMYCEDDDLYFDDEVVAVGNVDADLLDGLDSTAFFKVDSAIETALAIKTPSVTAGDGITGSEADPLILTGGTAYSGANYGGNVNVYGGVTPGGVGGVNVSGRYVNVTGNTSVDINGPLYVDDVSANSVTSGSLTSLSTIHALSDVYAEQDIIAGGNIYASADRDGFFDWALGWNPPREWSDIPWFDEQDNTSLVIYSNRTYSAAVDEVLYCKRDCRIKYTVTTEADDGSWLYGGDAGYHPDGQITNVLYVGGYNLSTSVVVDCQAGWSYQITCGGSSPAGTLSLEILPSSSISLGRVNLLSEDDGQSVLYVDGTNLMFRATNGVAAKVMLEFAPN